jgi:hypothetical protein
MSFLKECDKRSEIGVPMKRKCKIEVYSLTKEHIFEVSGDLTHPTNFEEVILKFYLPEEAQGAKGVDRIFYNWLATAYNFENGALDKREDFERFIRVSFENGEMWELDGCWPRAINFGDLDHSGSSPVEVELTVTFKTLTIYFGGEKTLCIMR